eukprot:XP_001698364.1 origin recognition complex subunit 1 [Chlamydomonas reinhardtii]
MDSIHSVSGSLNAAGPLNGSRAAAAQKSQKPALIGTRNATKRTLALAARTAAVTQAASVTPAPPPATTPKRKRRGEDTEQDNDVVLVEHDEEQQQQQDGDEDMEETEAVAAAAKAPNARGRGRRAGAAAPAPPEADKAAGTAAAAQRRSTRAKAAAAAEAPVPAGKASGKGGAAAAAAPAARGKKDGGEAAAAAGGRSTVRHMNSWEVHGEKIHVGDDVYVVEAEDSSQLPGDDEDEPCCVCSRNTDTRRMVECDRCLRGFHFRCLKPALKKLPDGDWLCPDCVAGVPATAHADRHIATSSQAFLFGNKILGLARVTGWMKDRKGEVQVVVRHYKKPEETHMGRQAHHHPREVFLGVGEHVESAACIWSRADVVGPARFAETGGTDTYICEYEYDDRWKRFRRRLASDEDPSAAAASDDDDEWGAAVPSTAAAGGKRRGAGAGAARGGRGRGGADAASSGEEYEAEESDESDRDEEYKPRNTLDGWVIRKPRGAGAARPGLPTRQAAGGRGRGHSYKALLDEEGTGLLLDQGAAAVPERGPVGPLAAARRALALNNTTGGLPCRETEKTALRRFISGAVEEGGDSPGVLYVCGVPGTGKTACCMEVLGGVRQQAQASGVQLVILNALQLPSPQHVYSKLWERMSGQRWGPARALKALEEAFSGGVGAAAGRRHMTLLIVDEIDVLITKDQAVLYNLFEWPMREGSRLAVIGISNTHDLDSRVLPRIASRLSGSKLAFNPYNFEQLQLILNSRLQGVTAVAKGALDFCARKVASTTGDVRRALELLRRATEIAETERAAAAAARGQPPPEDLTGAVGVRQALHARLTSHLALLTPAAALPLSRVVEAAAALGGQRLVLAEPGWQGPAMRLTLNVPQERHLVMYVDGFGVVC